MKISLAAISMVLASAGVTTAFAPLPISPLSRSRSLSSTPMKTSGKNVIHQHNQKLPFRPLTSSTPSTPSTQSSTSTSLSAYLSITENTPRQMPPFLEWAETNGVQKIEGVDLYSEDNLDWFAITTVDIPAGTTILYVPAELVLRSSQVEQELNAISEGGVAAAADQLNRIGSGAELQEFYLFLKVLVEYEKGDQSPYFAWMDSWPRLYFNAVSMTDFCYECLPPLVFSLSRTEKVKFDNFCQVLGKVDVISPQIKNDREVLKWAFNAIFTRESMNKEGLGSDAAIAPWAGMFNHGANPTVDIAFDDSGNCMAYTLTDVPANSILHVSYGDPTNPSYLFAKYGFLDESSPATFCKIMDIPKTEENINVGLDFSKMLFYVETGDISQEVMDVVLYAKVLSQLKYNPDEPDYKSLFYQAVMTGDENTKQAISEQFRYETIIEIKKHVDGFLMQLDALAAKSEGRSFEEHPRLPLILQHNEWVRQTFLKVKENLDAFVSQYEGMGQQQYA